MGFLEHKQPVTNMQAKYVTTPPPRGFRPSASTSRARQSDVATSDKDKQICFMLMPRT